MSLNAVSPKERGRKIAASTTAIIRQPVAPNQIFDILVKDTPSEPF